MNRLTALSLLAAATGALVASDASAAPVLRVQVDQRGDFVMIGNTLGQDCANGVVAPVVGTIGNCGNSTGDNAPDVFWRSESPGAGQAAANNTITAANARSTAVLGLPPGAVVTNAYLYWGSRGDTADTTVTLSRPGGGFSSVVTATSAFTTTTNSGDPGWQSVADITAIVQAQGVGAYNLSNVALTAVVNQNQNVNFGAWSMVVLYEDDLAPLRNLAVFDGLDGVSNGSGQTVTLDGFLVPNAGFDGKLGVIAYEGDDQATGDQLLFGATPLTNATNPVNNFFNSSRTFLGAAVTTVGDLPQLAGGPRSMSSYDLDVVDVTALLTPGQTSTTLTASSTGDVYFLGAFITSISTFSPDFTTSEKTALDVNGPPLVAGDTVEFTIVVENTGNDDAVDTVLTDVLPAGLTFVPGTLRVDGGPVLTEANGDDTFDYDAGTDTIVVRLGLGADAASGGLVAQGESTTVVFRVTIDAGAGGILENQARITAEGLLGAPVEEWPTGSSEGPGTPTPIPVDQCLTSADCAAPTPVCDTAADPNRCVECVGNGDCGGLTPICDVPSGTCLCIAQGGETCNGLDDDCNGTVDDGNPGGGAGCVSGLPGICSAGTELCTGGGIACAPDVAPGSQEDVCGDGIDQDCDGTADQLCGDTDGDGIIDRTELEIGTDPNDADSDDDGVRDGDEPDFDQDTDGDGLINALDPDSDDDGLFDGTELGFGCDDAATNAAAGHCRLDGDAGATTTDPLNADTDGGGVSDGSEDFDLDGVLDAGETDPTAGQGDDDDDNDDTDGDGLSNGLEATLGSDPNDADSDDDGVPDGQEHNPSDDTDGDGLINVLDPDSDDDGLFDGTEMGLGCDDAATDASAGHCRPDADGGATTTSPLDPDSDHGGVSDGAEDSNLNGAIDAGELDPNDPGDDATVIDSDGDGLSDALEEFLGSDPLDADSDDDGAPDGAEANPSDDTDGDGIINILDPDSDGDGLFDGTELGFGCDDPATDPSANVCIADGDLGATTTSMVDADSDDGGVSDGDEDTNHNGVVDSGETDPNDPVDDRACDEDAECGGPTSGLVCSDGGVCVDGCRGLGGNGCPEGETCTSADDSIGACVPGGAGGGGAGPSSTGSTGTTTGAGAATGTASGGQGGAGEGGAGSGGDDLNGLVASGNGILCTAAPGGGGSSGGSSGEAPWLLALVGAAAMLRRRRAS